MSTGDRTRFIIPVLHKLVYMSHERMIFDSQMVFKNLWATVALVPLVLMAHFYMLLVGRLGSPVALALNAVEWVLAKPVLRDVKTSFIH